MAVLLSNSFARAPFAQKDGSHQNRGQGAPKPAPMLCARPLKSSVRTSPMSPNATLRPAADDGPDSAKPKPNVIPALEVSTPSTTVQVAGVRLPYNEAPLNPQGVPSAQQSRMLVTPSMTEAMRFLCKSWADRVPVKLEGATGVGKTAAIRYLAHTTNSEYIRVNLSYFTEVEDLLGRYVGGSSEHTTVKLGSKSDEELCQVARNLGLVPEGGRDALTALILREQGKIRWVDGPVVKALKSGAILLLDEINLARPEVIEALNGLFDRGQLMSGRDVQEIKAHENFRVFATQNPSSYAGRQDMSQALSSRWSTLTWEPLPADELFSIVQDRYKTGIPPLLFSKLCMAHTKLAELAEAGRLGQDRGGVAYTLRDLFKVADRYMRYRPKHTEAEMSDEYLVAREAFEVYLGGLEDPEDCQRVRSELNRVLSCINEDFYKGLTLERTPTGYRLGDVELDERSAGGAFVPTTDLVMTPTTLPIYARMLKALDMGENVALIGERASGKSAMAEAYAAHSKRRFYPEHFDAGMDGSRLIGTDTPQGWQDGLLLHAARGGGVLLADEFNLAPPEILERLNSLMDDERVLVLSEKEGERVTLHPDFCFVATMNPPKYAGRHKLSRAMLNRLTCIAVPTLEAAQDLRPIVDHKLSTRHGQAPAAVNAAIAGAMVGLHTWVSRAYKTGELGTTLRRKEVPDYSLRQVLYALRLMTRFSSEEGVAQALRDALTMGYAQQGAPEDKKVVRERIEAAVKEVEAALGPDYVPPTAVPETAPQEDGTRTIFLHDGVYHGETKDGLAHGIGTEQFLDGTTYEGQFDKGLRHGRGVLRAVDRIYSGDFAEGKLSGRGILRFASGDRYEGDFENDTFQGKGTYFYADGSRFDGEFLHGQLVKGTMYTGNGEQRDYDTGIGKAAEGKTGDAKAAATAAAAASVPHVSVDDGIAKFKGDLFEVGLATWVATAPPQIHSSYQRAANAIREARKYKSSSLNLYNLGLRTLPAEIADLAPHLTAVNMNGNDFGTLPREIGHLVNLTNLQAERCYITTVTDDIGKLTKLQTLSLADNAVRALPPEIGKCRALKHLDLRSNMLTALPPEVGQLNLLTGFYCRKNQIGQLPDTVRGWTSIEKIDLADNHLSSLPADLSGWRYLQGLYLDNNQLQALPLGLGAAADLRDLYLEHNQLTAMPDIFDRFTNLTALRVLDNPLGKLPDSLVKCRHLETLSLQPKGGLWPKSAGDMPLKRIILPQTKGLGQRIEEGVFFVGMPMQFRFLVEWE